METEGVNTVYILQVVMLSYTTCKTHDYEHLFWGLIFTVRIIKILCIVNVMLCILMCTLTEHFILTQLGRDTKRSSNLKWNPLPHCKQKFLALDNNKKMQFSTNGLLYQRTSVQALCCSVCVSGLTLQLPSALQPRLSLKSRIWSRSDTEPPHGFLPCRAGFGSS